MSRVSTIKGSKIGMDKKNSVNVEDPNEIYVQEIVSARNWHDSLSEASKKLGCLGKFNSRGSTKNTSTVISQKVAEKLGKKDKKIQIYSTYFDKIDEEASLDPNAVDFWLKFLEDARTESLLTTKFWAYIQGFSVKRMRQLQENQATILDNIIQSFNISMTNDAENKNKSMVQFDSDEEENQPKKLTWKILNLTELYPWMMENKFDNRQKFYTFMKKNL
jgi:hypothetical protein